MLPTDGSTPARFDVHHHDQAVLADRDDVRHMTALRAVDPRHEPKRLLHDPTQPAIPIRQQQPGKLQPRLIADVATHHGRPVPARIVGLSTSPPERHPRQHAVKVHGNPHVELNLVHAARAPKS
nr:hypothetical protein [Pseudofrankia asymbiotica]